MNRRAKIVCTLGPAVDTAEQVQSLIQAGLDTARLNFSHGLHEEHARRLALVRSCAEKLNKPVAVLMDLSGPKIRTGWVLPSQPQVQQGDKVELVEGDKATYPEIAIVHEGFAEGLRPDDRVLLDDGRITLRVTDTSLGRAQCVAEIGGVLRDHVGVHLPARSVRAATLTEKDRDDLRFGLQQGVDYVAVSFVRSAEDIRQVRALCLEQGCPTPIVAKIETPQAVDLIEAITQEADAVMVARGDLGVEFPPEAVPVLQKKIIGVAHRLRRPVIVATEMLQSMVHAIRPTRAEASDVAHAVFDGADAVMLSAETAMGEHPSLAVDTMARIVVEAERSIAQVCSNRLATGGKDVSESIAFNAADIAEEIGARAIVSFTLRGTTARLVSQARPWVPHYALSPSAQVCRQMALYWGVIPAKAEQMQHTSELLSQANAHLLEQQLIRPGERFVAVFGTPLGQVVGANSISVRVAEG